MNTKEVLIIDDEPRFRRSIVRALEPDDYSFLHADSIASGVTEYRNLQGSGVILLDLDLGGGENGKGFLELMGGAISKHRVIVLTAHEEYLAAASATEFAVFRYLHKPQERVMESLRFTVAQGFKDIEAEQLKDKNKLLNRIQRQINSSIQESTPTEHTQDALRNVLSLIAESVREVVGAYTSHIRVYNLKKGDFHLEAFAGDNDSFRKIFALPKQKDEPFSGIVAAHREARHYPDLQVDPEFKKWMTKSLERIKQLNDAVLLENAEKYFKAVKSAFIAPITTHLFADETDAVFNVSSDSLNFFSSEKQDTILEFVAQATTAITKAWQNQRKHESHRDYRGISQVLEHMSRQLLGEDDKSRIYDTVIDGISEIIKPEAISIFLYNPITDVLDNEAEFRGSQRHEPNAKGNPINEGLTALVFSSGMPLRVPNLQTNERMKPWEHPKASKELYAEYVQRLPSHRVDHYLAVPMIVGNEKIGSIQLLNKKSAYYENEEIDKERWLLERGFSDDCENVLGIAANHLAVAIRNAQLLEHQRKQTTGLAILKDVGRFRRSDDDLKQLLKRIITEAAEGAQAELCLLFLLDKNQVVLKERYGISEEELPEASYDIGYGFTGEVVKTHKSILIERNVPQGKYDHEILEHLRKRYGPDKQIESLMVVPIMAGDQCKGVIKVINKKGPNPYYDQDDLKFFEDFGSYVGLAIENQQRYDTAVDQLAAALSHSTLSNLVAATAHETSNTRGLIPAYVKKLEQVDSIRSNATALDLLHRITDVAMQSVYFSNEIAGYSLGKKGEKRLLDINDLVRKCYEEIPEFRRPSNFDEIKVIPRLSRVPLIADIHENPLVQTLRNIVINAYQALESRKSGEIRISTSKNVEANEAFIKISDTGCGIDEKYKDQIFEPNFTTKPGTGSGIGLWLAKRHIEDIGGKITFTSIKDEGTTFSLVIPLAEHLSK
jgi:GAF domain-containing protein